MKSHRPILSLILGIALIAAGAAMVPAFAATDKTEPPPNSDCSFDSSRWERPERRWRELTFNAEAFSAEASTARRRPVRPGEEEPPVPRRNFVDEEIFGTMESAGVKPTRYALTKKEKGKSCRYFHDELNYASLNNIKMRTYFNAN